MASPVAPMKTHKTEASRASKQSWPLAKPLLALAAASLCAGSEGRRMARSVSRADLVGRLRANKYGKTEQEDCVSSTHSPHCLFVTGPRTPGRAFQACPADTERSHRFPDEAKTRKGGRHIGNQAREPRGLQGQGRVWLPWTLRRDLNNIRSCRLYSPSVQSDGGEWIHVWKRQEHLKNEQFRGMKSKRTDMEAFQDMVMHQKASCKTILTE